MNHPRLVFGLLKSLGSAGGMKVIAIGPKGGQIVGYLNGDLKKPIYAGSAGAKYLAKTLKKDAGHMGVAELTDMLGHFGATVLGGHTFEGVTFATVEATTQSALHHAAGAAGAALQSIKKTGATWQGVIHTGHVPAHAKANGNLIGHSPGGMKPNGWPDEIPSPGSFITKTHEGHTYLLGVGVASDGSPKFFVRAPAHAPLYTYTPAPGGGKGAKIGKAVETATPQVMSFKSISDAAMAIYGVNAEGLQKQVNGKTFWGAKGDDAVVNPDHGTSANDAHVDTGKSDVPAPDVLIDETPATAPPPPAPKKSGWDAWKLKHPEGLDGAPAGTTFKVTESDGDTFLYAKGTDGNWTVDGSGVATSAQVSAALDSDSGAGHEVIGNTPIVVAAPPAPPPTKFETWAEFKAANKYAHQGQVLAWLTSAPAGTQFHTAQWSYTKNANGKWDNQLHHVTVTSANLATASAQFEDGPPTPPPAAPEPVIKDMTPVLPTLDEWASDIPVDAADAYKTDWLTTAPPGAVVVTKNHGKPPVPWLSIQGDSWKAPDGKTLTTATLVALHNLHSAGGPELLPAESAPAPVPGNPGQHVFDLHGHQIHVEAALDGGYVVVDLGDPDDVGLHLSSPSALKAHLDALAGGEFMSTAEIHDVLAGKVITPSAPPPAAPAVPKASGWDAWAAKQPKDGSSMAPVAPEAPPAVAAPAAPATPAPAPNAASWAKAGVLPGHHTKKKLGALGKAPQNAGKAAAFTAVMQADGTAGYQITLPEGGAFHYGPDGKAKIPPETVAPGGSMIFPTASLAGKAVTNGEVNGITFYGLKADPSGKWFATVISKGGEAPPAPAPVAPPVAAPAHPLDDWKAAEWGTVKPPPAATVHDVKAWLFNAPKGAVVSTGSGKTFIATGGGEWSNYGVIVGSGPVAMQGVKVVSPAPATPSEAPDLTSIPGAPDKLPGWLDALPDGAHVTDKDGDEWKKMLGGKWATVAFANSNPSYSGASAADSMLNYHPFKAVTLPGPLAPAPAVPKASGWDAWKSAHPGTNASTPKLAGWLDAAPEGAQVVDNDNDVWGKQPGGTWTSTGFKEDGTPSAVYPNFAAATLGGYDPKPGGAPAPAVAAATAPPAAPAPASAPKPSGWDAWKAAKPGAGEPTWKTTDWLDAAPEGSQVTDSDGDIHTKKPSGWYATGEHVGGGSGYAAAGMFTSNMKLAGLEPTIYDPAAPAAVALPGQSAAAPAAPAPAAPAAATWASKHADVEGNATTTVSWLVEAPIGASVSDSDGDVYVKKSGTTWEATGLNKAGGKGTLVAGHLMGAALLAAYKPAPFGASAVAPTAAPTSPGDAFAAAYPAHTTTTIGLQLWLGGAPAGSQVHAKGEVWTKTPHAGWQTAAGGHKTTTQLVKANPKPFTIDPAVAAWAATVAPDVIGGSGKQHYTTAATTAPVGAAFKAANGSIYQKTTGVYWTKITGASGSKKVSNNSIASPYGALQGVPMTAEESALLAHGAKSKVAKPAAAGGTAGQTFVAPPYTPPVVSHVAKPALPPVVGPDGKTYPGGTTFKETEVHTLKQQKLAESFSAAGVTAEFAPHNKPGWTTLKLPVQQLVAKFGSAADLKTVAAPLVAEHLTSIGVKGWSPEIQHVGGTYAFAAVKTDDLAVVVSTKTEVQVILPTGAGAPPNHEDLADSALLNGPLAQTGHAIDFDGKFVRDLHLSVRRAKDNLGVPHHEVVFKLAPEGIKIANASAAMKAAPDGNWTLRPGSYDPTTGVTSHKDQSFQHVECKVISGNGWKAYIVPTTSSAWSLADSVRVVVDQGTTPHQAMFELSAALGLPGMMAAPTDEDRHQYIVNKTLWNAAPQDHDSMFGAYRKAAVSTADAKKALAAVGITDADLAKAEVVDIMPGHKAVKLQDGQKFRDKGVIGLKHDWTYGSPPGTPAQLAAAIAGGGFSPTAKRWAAGIGGVGAEKMGASPDADIQTGGAAYFFTRPALAGQLPSHGINLIFGTEILERTDWHGSTTDSYGRSRPTDMHFKDRPGRYSVKSHHETDVQGGAGVGELRAITCDQHNRTAVIQALKARGIHEINGIPVEKFVTTSSAEAESAVSAQWQNTQAARNA